MNLNQYTNISGDKVIADLFTLRNSITGSMERNTELEKQLSMSKYDLQNNKLGTIGLLASGLVHDLRNHLSVIMNTLELMEMESIKRNDENEKKKFDRLDRAISRMTHQMDSVMDFVRIKPLKFEAVSISEIVKSAVQSIKKPKNIRIDIPKNPIHLVCDAKKLEGVFTNIILNAVHAVGEKGRITIRTEEKTDHICVEVKDTGPGVSHDIADKIFDPLFTTKPYGTGLGLPTCKSIVEQHDGTIIVRNNPSRFIIMLPNNLSTKLKAL